MLAIEMVARIARNRDTMGCITVEPAAEKVVVGLPLNMDGTEGDRAQKARAFGELLGDACGLPVVMWDERGTSVTANRMLSDAGKKRGKQRQKVDAVAATIILQSFLDAVGR